jgi:hypothetical protein
LGNGITLCEVGQQILRSFVDPLQDRDLSGRAPTNYILQAVFASI